MDPLVKKIARAVMSERGRDPDELLRFPSTDKWVPYWTMEVEYVERLRIALRMLAEAEGEQKAEPASEDRPDTPAARLAEMLEKHPELSAYKYPATAGDIAEVGKKLDEIAGLLRSALSANADEADAIKSLLERFIANRNT